MLTIGSILGQTSLYFVLFATFALAALQNVTVDDAALTGPVVPQYLSSGAAWNVNHDNNCSTCAAHPDPAMTYGGTWHDATFQPSDGTTFRSFEFSFVGSALYIYFILANAPNGYLLNSPTAVNFTLDGVTASSYIQQSTQGDDYQYNVLVFAIDSLTSSVHTMKVQPFVPPHIMNGSILILFDYLIYTTEADENQTSSVSPTITSPNPSTVMSSVSSITMSTTPTASGMPSRQNVGTIVGGILAGVSAIALVAASLFCYRRYRRRGMGPHYDHVVEPVMDPFTSPQMAPTPLEWISPSVHRNSGTNPIEGSEPNASPVTMPSSIPSSSSGNVSTVLDQIASLRGEVARLRERQDHNQNVTGVGPEAPPEYDML